MKYLHFHLFPLQNHRINTLEESLKTPLEFKIPTSKLLHVQSYPEIFQLADSEISETLSYYISGVPLGGGGGGSSETLTANADAVWISFFRLCCSGIIECYNQKDKSNKISLRFDVVLSANSAMFLKGVQKSTQDDNATAAVELVDKLHPNAHQVFPMGSQSILGFLSSRQTITMLRISRQEDRYFTHSPQQFNLEFERGRVEYLVYLMKFLRYVVTIERPDQAFHLLPGIRKKTRNGHFVTWMNEGILKEYCTLQSEQQMEWIDAIYKLKLPHVEYGYLLDLEFKMSVATRVGRKLDACISDQTITRDVAFQQIQLGISEMHEKGFAHCDICVDNCLVDCSDPTPIAFLTDLEYIRPVGDPPPSPPHNNRLSPETELPSTARELDLLQLRSLRLQMIHI